VYNSRLSRISTQPTVQYFYSGEVLTA